jgi:uncharacterized ferritin-like protein (DUF455 family)
MAGRTENMQLFKILVKKYQTIRLRPSLNNLNIYRELLHY